MRNHFTRLGYVSFMVLVIVSFCLIFSATGQAANVIKWRCQAGIAVASPTYAESVVRVANLVKARTNGRLVIETYPAGALVPNEEIFPAVKRGMLEMGFAVPSYWKTDIPLSQVCALPYAFKNYWEVMYFYKKLGFEKMLSDEVLKHNVLYWTDHALPVEIVTKTPIRSLNDLKGKKIRTYGQFAKFFKELGAQPVSASGPEIYTGLATGVFEGAHWAGAVGANSLALYEVCKYHMKPAISLGTEEGFFVSKRAFDKLPKDIQAIVKDILDNQFWVRTVEYAYHEDEVLGRVTDKMGVQVIDLPAADQKKMAQAAMKIWDEIGQTGPNNKKAIDMLKKFLTDIGRL
jgi:TRAP-type C4-dicarboxylate transport system substrate-binding protein